MHHPDPRPVQISQHLCLHGEIGIPRQHHAHRRAALQTRQPASEIRIVGDDGAPADQDGVGLGAQQMSTRPCGLACRPERRAVALRDRAIRVQRKLELHERPPGGDPQLMAERQPARLGRERSRRHRNTMRAQPGQASTRDARIGIDDAVNHARDAGARSPHPNRAAFVPNARMAPAWRKGSRRAPRRPHRRAR